MLELISLIIEVLGLLISTPAGKRHARMSEVRQAFKRAEEAGDDTGAIEDLVNH